MLITEHLICQKCFEQLEKRGYYDPIISLQIFADQGLSSLVWVYSDCQDNCLFTTFQSYNLDKLTNDLFSMWLFGSSISFERDLLQENLSWEVSDHVEL